MKKIVVLTGAGISAESGISTFRDSDGLWEQYRVEDVATHEAYLRNPELVLNFYNERRRQLFSVKPNEGHRQLVRLEQKYDVHIITQNIDNLHEQAGSTNVLHLHGELTNTLATKHPTVPSCVPTSSGSAKLSPTSNPPPNSAKKPTTSSSSAPP